MPHAASPLAQPLLARAQPCPSGTYRKNAFDTRVEEDDPIWKEYVEAAAEFDKRMVENWNKILDVILVFIALFISAMTPFVIETSKEFDPNPAEMTNNILIALYNKPTNGSSVPEIHISNFLASDPSDPDYSKAIFSNRLLYASLALSIVISMISMTTRVWLVRYTYRVRSSGSPYAQAMLRQGAYSGVEAWKLGSIIEALPLLVLIAVYLFGLYIHVSVGKQYREIGYIVGTTFFAGLTFLFAASFTAAFIPSSPFHSCISDITAFLFTKFLPARYGSSTKWRNLIILVTFVLAAVLTTHLVLTTSPTYQVIIFYPLACVFAVARLPTRSQDAPPQRISLPGSIFLLGIAIFPLMATASWYNTNPPVFISLSIVAFVSMAGGGVIVSKLTKVVPDTLEAEAITWLLESSSPSNSLIFKKAAQIGYTEQRKHLLSKALLPHLPALIASRLRPQRGELGRHELEIYVSSLASLLDFNVSKGGPYFSNTAAVKHPVLSCILLAQLEVLKSHPSPPIREAAKAVWSHLVEPHVEDGNNLRGGSMV